MKYLAAGLALLGLTTAAPAPVDKRWPIGANIIKPDYISQYTINSGELKYQPSPAKAYFDKYTIISTFTIPSLPSGSKCRIGFWLDTTDTTAKYTGSGVAQIFTSQKAPPKNDVASWPQGNLRDQHYGNLKAVKPGDATVDDWPRTLESFPCPKAGAYAVEYMAKWDVNVDWNPAVSGVYIKWT